MPSKMFVNLPVKDLPASKAFFEALGFTFDPAFTDERAACMVVGESNFVMLLTEAYFTSFTGRPVADTSTTTEVIVAVSQDTVDAVDRMGAAASAAGGKPAEATQEASPMHTRAFHDLDGHLWEIFHIPSTS
ncbi:glyoxalase [Streptomyces sp. NBC_00433]